MNKYLEQLVQLSKYDGKISAYEPKIENEKSKLALFFTNSRFNFNNNQFDFSRSRRVKNQKKSKKTNTHLVELKKTKT